MNEILIEIIALKYLMEKILYGRRWYNYTFSYTEIDQRELYEKMKKAWKKIQFQPPLEKRNGR